MAADSDKLKPEMRGKSLKRSLDALYRSYDFAGRVEHDPIIFPKKYRDKGDREAAGLVAAVLAYGKVTSFMPVVERILGSMGESPSAYLADLDLRGARRALHGVSYRFQGPDDILALLYSIGGLIRRRGSLEGAFMAHYSGGNPTTGPALAGLVEEIIEVDTSRVFGRKEKPRGFLQLFPSPRRGSACKRLNLYLRWMVRNHDIDLGLWKGVSPSKLVVPLDAHIARVSRCLGFTSRKSNDWKTAVEITGALRELDPKDPLKYDFALCHRGIMGLCKANLCKECELWN
jgi:uncharacterized protein (TIGR02757 family)